MFTAVGHQSEPRTFTLAAMLVVAVLVYFGVPADYAIHKRAASVTRASGQREMDLRLTNASSNDANQNAGTNVVTASISTRNHLVPASQNNSGVNDLSVHMKTRPVVDSPVISTLGKKWSVQIAAEPTKDIADTLVQRLKAKSYDGYVVTAVVKGQAFYRVRVGQFDSREKAESLRQWFRVEKVIVTHISPAIERLRRGSLSGVTSPASSNSTAPFGQLRR